MEHKYQWSTFTDASKMEQYVVRCDEIQDLVDSIALVKAAMQQEREEVTHMDVPAETPTPEEQQGQYCTIHQKPMKLRTKHSCSFEDSALSSDNRHNYWHV